MSEMISKVAAALAKHRGVRIADEVDQRLFEADARVAIEAMRSPTQAMCDAGFSVQPDDRDRFDNYPEQHRLAMGPKWRVMIDEALK